MSNNKDKRETQIVEKDYIRKEMFRGKWIDIKGVRARPEAIEELNRDTFRTGIKYEEGKMTPKKEEKEAEKPLDERSIAELKFYAEENGIDLGDAKKKAEILAAIKNA